MSWLNNMAYQKETGVCDCADGKHRITITNIKQEQFQQTGANILAVYLAVADTSWNQIPYRHAIFEGENFDYGFSRLCDCFGVDMTANANAFANFDFSAFRGTDGVADFAHTKRKQVTEGFDANGLPKRKWVTEKSDYVNARLVKKGTPAETFPEDIPYAPSAGTKPQPAPQGMSAKDTAGANAAFDNPKPAQTQAAPATFEPKGGNNTPAEADRLNKLVLAKYANGTRVFSNDEIQLYQSYRKDMTAAQLIAFVENALKQRRPDAPELNDGQLPVF